jgi:hypothetical protein
MTDIDDMMQATGDDTKNTFKILECLTDKERTRLFSELDDREIKAITRLEFISRLLKNKYGKHVLNLDLFIQTFMDMRVSKKRASRNEFVNAFKSERGDDFEKAMMRQRTQVMR